MTTDTVNGYTLADIDRMSHAAASRYADDETRIAAWEAIVTLLCETGERPAPWILFQAGARAARQSNRHSWQLQGYQANDSGKENQGFFRYWLDPTANDMLPGWHRGDGDGRLVELIGFRQAWPELEPKHQVTFVALAAADDNVASAAESLGVSRATMYRRITDARQAWEDING